MKIFQHIGKGLGIVWRPIGANTVFFAGLYVLGVVSAWLTIPNTPSGKLYDNLYLELFLDLYVLCTLLMIVSAFPARFSSRIRRWLKLLLCFFFYGIAIIDVYCFEKYGSSLTPSMLMLVGETDSREAGEFLRSCLSIDTLSGGVGWMLLIAGIHAVIDILLRYKQRKLSRITLRPEVNRLFTTILGALTTGILIWSSFTSYQNKQGLWRLMTLSTVGAVENEVTRYHRADTYQPVYRLAFSIRANKLAARQVDQLVAAAGKVSVDSCSFTSPTIVLIIGESYNKHHAQLYGYYIPTTPRQMEREQSGQLVKYSNVVSPWNLTSFVFKHMFSTHVIGQEGSWSDYPLFPAIFRKAGYDVTFLTNQFVTKAKEAVYDFSGGFFLNNPQLSAEMFDHRNAVTHIWDDGLLKDWDLLAAHASDTTRQDSSAHRLVIIHLLGQHMNYYSRYPKKQTRFNVADYERYRPKMIARRKQQLIWYDNATLYNDSIVDQICRRFEEQEAIVVYVPDHGEEIYESGRFIICRNHTDDIDFPLAYYEYEIPFWVWCSKSYIDHHPDIFQQVKEAKDRRFMIDALPHMLLYLAGIHSKDYIEKHNILSAEYDSLRPRMLKELVDYDRLPRDMSSKRTAGAPKKNTK